MSRVITFSRVFPATHPRKGEPTFFVEKIWESIYLDQYNTIVAEQFDFSKLHAIGIDIYANGKYPAKHHTIRGGNRWKVGDKFSPRVWSGKPYASKQIVIAPDIEIKKVWTFEYDALLGFYSLSGLPFGFDINQVAQNDGLTKPDFDAWFRIHPKSKQQYFEGQILCWNENIEYR